LQREQKNKIMSQNSSKKKKPHQNSKNKNKNSPPFIYNIEECLRFFYFHIFEYAHILNKMLECDALFSSCAMRKIPASWWMNS
jgi:hypothetical protein